MANSSSSNRLSGILASLDAQFATSDSDKPISAMPIADTYTLIEKEAAKQAKKLQDTEDGTALVALVKGWVKQCRNVRLAEERQWYKDLDMYSGRQYTEWNTTTSSMQPIPMLDDEPRVVVNLIEPAVRIELAKVASTQPTAYVVPASNDQADIIAALAGEQVWEYHQRESYFRSRVFDPANLWRATTGNAFLKSYVDRGIEDTAATAAAMQEFEEQMEQLSSAQPDPNTGMLPPIPNPPKPVMGLISGTYLTPFHLLVPDMTEIDLQKQPYVIHQFQMAKSKAKLVYQDALPDDWTGTATSQDEIVRYSHLGIKSGTKPTGSDQVIVYEVYVKPGFHPKMPQGGFMVLVGDTLVGTKLDGMAYAHGEYPFHHMYGIETGRFYRKSMVQSVTPIQDQINRTYAQIIKHRNLMTKPQMFYDEGSVEPTKIRSKAGVWIPVRLGFRYPTAVPVQEMPGFVTQFLDRLSLNQDDISGQHGPSRGITPGADTAASAVSLLQESDNDMLTTVMNGIHSCMQSYARQVLNLAVQFWDQKRLVKVGGQESAADVKMLSGADLKHGTDLWLDDDSFLLQSRTQKNATLTDWMKQGLIPPDVGLAALNQGLLGKAWQQMNRDKHAAQLECLQFAKTDPGEIAQWMQAQQAQQAQQQQAQAAASPNPLLADWDHDGDIDIPGAPDVDPNNPAPNPLPQPAAPARVGGNPVVQPGAIAPAQPGQLMGPAAPSQPLPQAPIFFPINWYDNDQVHMTVLRDWANSGEFKLLDPLVQQAAQDHYYAHLTRSLNLAAASSERYAAQSAQQSAELAQQSPTVQQTARIGGKAQYAEYQGGPTA